MKRYHDEHSEERGSTKGGPFPCSFCDKRFYYMKVLKNSIQTRYNRKYLDILRIILHICTA